jgi:hypothetical protein
MTQNEMQISSEVAIGDLKSTATFESVEYVLGFVLSLENI